MRETHAHVTVPQRRESVRNEETVTRIAHSTDEATKCGRLFNLCCRAPDPLNGDKCQSLRRTCQSTPSLPPPQINAASVKGASSVHSPLKSACYLFTLVGERMEE
ncbi:hypothetical protein PRIPAC_88845 [Pristionchus pacificus]|uniref:Uncharacterized protein n=1 Tax=Pristionchus pacificus TaxID=54126 RepID=A0A2A6B9M0_PRIPA|nr:hypothetical protein PRIPAC_88845 [Pristionchus pacificus]|eukprot:PDM62563.1 hypothetical protein PRIPAC_52005 [Pristionchus pacificus]